VHFLASTETFAVIEYHFDILAKRLRELSFLNNGVKIQLVDQRSARRKTSPTRGGVKGFRRIHQQEQERASRDALSRDRPEGRHHGRSRHAVERLYQEQVLCFTNNIPQRDGGTHLSGLRAAMTRSLNQYIESNEIAKKAKVETSGDDMREGLSCVLSVKVPEPKFSSQTKDKLVVLRGSDQWSRNSSARS